MTTALSWETATGYFLKAADKLSLAPADCLVIEDAYSGLLAAKRAGSEQLLQLIHSVKQNSI